MSKLAAYKRLSAWRRASNAAAPELGKLTSAQTLAANPPIYFERNLRNMIAIARENDINVLLMTIAVNPNEWGIGATPYYLDATAEHIELIQQLALDLDVPIFDFASVMPLDSEFWVGSIHYSAAGEEVHAGLIAEFLTKKELIPQQP